METRKGKVIFLIYQNGRATNFPKPQFVTYLPQDVCTAGLSISSSGLTTEWLTKDKQGRGGEEANKSFWVLEIGSVAALGCWREWVYIYGYTTSKINSAHCYKLNSLIFFRCFFLITSIMDHCRSKRSFPYRISWFLGYGHDIYRRTGLLHTSVFAFVQIHHHILTNYSNCRIYH